MAARFARGTYALARASPFGARAPAHRAQVVSCRSTQARPEHTEHGDAGPFEVEHETVVHSRYLTVYNRSVRFPGASGPAHEYDVVGHPKCDFHFAVVFPFHPPTLPGGEAEVTLLREYCQGVNKMMYVLPTGGLDTKKHADVRECAVAELSEEALLTGGSMTRLLADDHPGFAEVKWCRNRFTPFLCVNPRQDADPGPRDLEEFIEVLRVPVTELRAIMISGDMMLPSITTSYMALERLRADGHL